MWGVCTWGTQLYGSTCAEVTDLSGLRINIGGKDVTGLCAPETYTRRGGLNRRTIASITLRDRQNSFRPQDGDSVIVTKDGLRNFAGTIEDFDETMIDGNPLTRVTNISAVDYNQILDKRVIVRNFETPGQTAGDIVRIIITEFLAEEGIVAGTIEDGVEVEKAIFNYDSASSSLDQLAQLGAMNWFVDNFKNLNFTGRSSLPAAITLTDGDQAFRNFRNSIKRNDYSNFIYLRGGTSISDPQNENFAGDSKRQTFNVGLPIDATPAIELNSVPQSVGIKGVSDETAFQWFFQRESTEITQRLTDAPLIVSDTLAVVYNGQFPLIIAGQLPSEIDERALVEGNSGKYEFVEENEDIDDRTLATDTVAALLARFGTIVNSVSFQKDDISVTPGQIITVNISEEAVDGDFLVTDVFFEEKDYQNRSIYTIKATSGQMVGSWVQWFRRLKRLGNRFQINENEVLEVLRTEIETVTASDVIDFVTSLDDGTNDPYTGLQVDGDADEIEFAHFIDQINIGKDQP